MAASVNNLTLVINRQDANGVNVENRTIGSISYSGGDGDFKVSQAPDTSSHALTLPYTGEANQAYFKNTHATAKITLVGTINGGSSQTLVTLEPGAVFVLWQTVAGKGFTALSYTSDTSGATFEYFIGG